MIPCVAIFIFYSDPIVSLLLERGNFSRDSAELTSTTLACLAIGIVGRSVAFFNYRLLNAMSLPWIVVKIGLLGVCNNIILNALLIKPLGLQGIALATSFSITISMIISTLILSNHLQLRIFSYLLKPFLKIIVMVGMLLLVGKGFWSSVIDGFEREGIMWQSMLTLGGLLPGMIMFTIVGLLVQLEEVVIVARIIRNKLLFL